MSLQSRIKSPQPCLVMYGGHRCCFWNCVEGLSQRVYLPSRSTHGNSHRACFSVFKGSLKSILGKFIPARPWALQYPRKASSPPQCATLFRLQYGGPFKQLLHVHASSPKLSCAWRMKGVQKCAEASLPAAVGFLLSTTPGV